MAAIFYLLLQHQGGGRDIKIRINDIRVNAERWHRRRKLFHSFCRDSNPRPFNHKPGALTTELNPVLSPLSYPHSRGHPLSFCHSWLHGQTIYSWTDTDHHKLISTTYRSWRNLKFTYDNMSANPIGPRACFAVLWLKEGSTDIAPAPRSHAFWKALGLHDAIGLHEAI